MSAVNKLLDRLDRVRQTGRGRWVARCPAHDDRRPSLSVAEGREGQALLYCFSGCSALEIVEALGLELRDLFDPPLEYRRPGRKPAPNYRERLELLAYEAALVGILAVDLADGYPLGKARQDRLLQAVERIARYAL